MIIIVKLEDSLPAAFEAFEVSLGALLALFCHDTSHSYLRSRLRRSVIKHPKLMCPHLTSARESLRSSLINHP